MAKSTTKDRNLKQFPKSPDSPEDPNATSTAVEDPPAEPSTPFDATPAEPTEKSKKTPKTLTFFQRVASIDRADWGERAKLKLYRLMPIINRLAGSEHKFVTIYGEPITEEKLKVDHGSGRYRLYLNYKTAGGTNEKEIDMIELDILDPAFPPKIPPGEWVDDPRNQKWAWARPAGAGQQPGQAQSTTPDPLAAFGTFMDIQDRVEERLKPQQPAAATPVDPWAAAEKILNMRSENPMMDFVKEQMKAGAAAAEAERDRAFKAAESARDREFKLQEKLLAASAAPPPTKNIFEQALELANSPEKLEPLKKLANAFGFGGGEATVRAGRTTGMDILNNLVSSEAGALLARGAAQFLVNVPSMIDRARVNPTDGNQPPPVNQQQQPQVLPPINQSQQENAEQKIARIGATITRPMIGEWFMKGATGQQFAAWMNDSWPDDYQFVKLLGAENLIQRYRSSPVWAAVSFREQEFISFIQEFCTWTEPKDEGQQTQIASDIEELEDGQEAQS